MLACRKASLDAPDLAGGHCGDFAIPIPIPDHRLLAGVLPSARAGNRSYSRREFLAGEERASDGASQPAEEMIAADPRVPALGSEFAERLARGATYDFESTEYFRLILKLRERRGDRWRYLWRLVWTPGAGDVAAVQIAGSAFSSLSNRAHWAAAAKVPLVETGLAPSPACVFALRPGETRQAASLQGRVIASAFPRRQARRLACQLSSAQRPCSLAPAPAGNSPGSLPASATFMNCIQMGRAARAPVSFSPSDFFSS